MPQVERSFIATPSGRVHIAACGAGAPILLLHQTPRSWDEFRDVLPLLGRHYRAIAMDTMGYGNSDPLPPGQASIENWAKAAHELLDALGIERVAVVGHHTGASIAIEIAAAYPAQVAALMFPQALTSTRRGGPKRRRTSAPSSMRLCRAWTAAIWPSFGRCARASIRRTGSISWSGLSSTP